MINNNADNGFVAELFPSEVEEGGGLSLPRKSSRYRNVDMRLVTLMFYTTTVSNLGQSLPSRRSNSLSPVRPQLVPGRAGQGRAGPGRAGPRRTRR